MLKLIGVTSKSARPHGEGDLEENQPTLFLLLLPTLREPGCGLLKEDHNDLGVNQGPPRAKISGVTQADSRSEGSNEKGQGS